MSVESRHRHHLEDAVYRRIMLDTVPGSNPAVYALTTALRFLTNQQVEQIIDELDNRYFGLKNGGPR